MSISVLFFATFVFVVSSDPERLFTVVVSVSTVQESDERAHERARSFPERLAISLVFA